MMEGKRIMKSIDGETKCKQQEVPLHPHFWVLKISSEEFNRAFIVNNMIGISVCEANIFPLISSIVAKLCLHTVS